MVSVGQATAAHPVGRTSGQSVSQALLHPAVPGFQPLWAPLRPTHPGPMGGLPGASCSWAGVPGLPVSDSTPPLPASLPFLPGEGMAGQLPPQRSCFRDTRGGCSEVPLHSQPGHLLGSTTEVLPASCPNRRPQEAPRSFGRHSPAMNSCFPSCELPLALRAQNWLPACGAPGGETEVWGVACWLFKHTAPPPRRVGPLLGARDSQRSHALDTSVRRLGQGPCWPLCTGLPAGVRDGQTSPWDCPPPLTLSSQSGPVCVPTRAKARAPAEHILSRDPRGWKQGPGSCDPLRLCPDSGRGLGWEGAPPQPPPPVASG